MSVRMRRPETRRLEISEGDWLLVKKHLTAGETRRVMARMIRPDGAAIDPVNVGLSKMIGYLLDWSIEDANGKPVVIRDRSESEMADILDNLDADSFREILKAIEEHEAEMDAEREAEKKSRTSETGSSPSSTSASGFRDGPSMTLTTSTPTSVQ